MTVQTGNVITEAAKKHVPRAFYGLDPLVRPLPAAAWVCAVFIATALFSNTVALRLLLLLVGAGLALAAVLRERDAVRAVPPLWLAFALWAAWAWLSLAWAIEPERSLKELRNEIVYAALAFWACYVAAQARDAARVLLPVVAAGAVLLCAVALYDFPRVHNGERWHGGAGNLSTMMLTLLPCALMAAWYGRRAGLRGVPAASLGVALLLLAGAYTTLNRTVWFGIALEVVLIGGLLAWRQRASIGPRARAIAAGAGLALIASTALVSSHIQTEREEKGVPIALAEDPRLQLWPEVLERIQERPLTGYGFGRGALRGPLSAELNNPLLWHAHNLFLDTALQLGIPGLALLVVLLAATLRAGWRLARSPDDFAAACGIAVLGVVAGMLMRNMTDMLWVRHNALVYWAVLGVLFAWGYGAERRAGG